MSYIIGLDMGGTEIKAGAISQTGEQLHEPLSFPSYSHKSKHELIQHIGGIIRQISQSQGLPDAIGFAFPGPFDYETGVSRIKGLNKYEALYGHSIADLLKTDANIDTPMFFINDVTAFALGIALEHNNKYERTLCVCIGTGCGSAFLVNGKAVTNGHPGIPKNGWIYSMPFRDTCLDDYLSKRGLEKITADVLGKPIDGKALSLMTTDKKAMACFSQFGSNLAEGLFPVIEAFKPTTLALGGQITASFEYFGQGITKVCKEKNINLSTHPHTSHLAIIGLWAEAKKREML